MMIHNPTESGPRGFLPFQRKISPVKWMVIHLLNDYNGIMSFAKANGLYVMYLGDYYIGKEIVPFINKMYVHPFLDWGFVRNPAYEHLYSNHVINRGE